MPAGTGSSSPASGVPAVVVAVGIILPCGLQSFSAVNEGTPRSTPVEVQKARTLEHPKWVRSLAFSPDSKRLAVSTADGAAFIWDIATGEATRPQLRKAHSKMSVRDAFVFLPSFRFVFSSDGKHLIWLRGKAVTVWDTSTGDLALVRDGLRAAAASPDGMMLALDTGDGVILWDVATRQARGSPVKGDLGEFSPDGHRLVIATPDGVLLVPVSEGQPVAIRFGDKEREFWAWRFSPDSSLLATAWKGRTVAWDVEKGQPVGPALSDDAFFWNQRTPWGRQHRCCYETTFSADNRLLAIRSPKGTELWEVATGAQVGKTMEAAFGNNTGGIWLLFSSKAPFLATSSAQYRPSLSGRKTSPLELWDLGALPPRMLESIEKAIPIAFSPDGDTLAYKLRGGFGLGAVGGPLGLWNARYRNTVAILIGKCPTMDSPNDGMPTPMFSPDGAWIACSGWPKWQDVTLWDISRVR